MRDNRYDAVIHLVTAAIGAETYYNLDNAARYEVILIQKCNELVILGISHRSRSEIIIRLGRTSLLDQNRQSNRVRQEGVARW